MSLLPSPSLTSRTTSSSAGVREAQPLDGRLALSTPALRVGDRLLGRQRGTFRPGGVEVAVVHGISKRFYGCVVPGLVDREANFTGALPDAVGCAEQPGRFAVTAAVTGKSRKNFEDVGNTETCADTGAAREGVVGVRSARSGSPSAIATRARVVSATARFQPDVTAIGIVHSASARRRDHRAPGLPGR